MRIWKFDLQITGAQELTLPLGARIRSVQFQHDVLCLWAEVDPIAPMEKRIIRIAGTGHGIGENWIYIGTVQQDGGDLVWHVYKEPRP